MFGRDYGITVPGRVVGKGRPRFTKAGRAYTPRATVEFEQRVRAVWIAAGHPMLTGPLAVRVTVVRPLPKSAPKSRDGEWDTHRPDLDNVVKAVLDALNGVAYEDDAQVVRIAATKARRYRGEPERVTVTVESLEGTEWQRYTR